jgi:hypothetical protein
VPRGSSATAKWRVGSGRSHALLLVLRKPVAAATVGPVKGGTVPKSVPGKVLGRVTLHERDLLTDVGNAATADSAWRNVSSRVVLARAAAADGHASVVPTVTLRMRVRAVGLGSESSSSSSKRLQLPPALWQHKRSAVCSAVAAVVAAACARVPQPRIKLLLSAVYLKHSVAVVGDTVWCKAEWRGSTLLNMRMVPVEQTTDTTTDSATTVVIPAATTDTVSGKATTPASMRQWVPQTDSTCGSRVTSLFLPVDEDELCELTISYYYYHNSHNSSTDTHKNNTAVTAVLLGIVKLTSAELVLTRDDVAQRHPLLLPLHSVTAAGSGGITAVVPAIEAYRVTAAVAVLSTRRVDMTPALADAATAAAARCRPWLELAAVDAHNLPVHRTTVPSATANVGAIVSPQSHSTTATSSTATAVNYSPVVQLNLNGFHVGRTDPQPSGLNSSAPVWADSPQVFRVRPQLVAFPPRGAARTAAASNMSMLLRTTSRLDVAAAVSKSAVNAAAVQWAQVRGQPFELRVTALAVSVPPPTLHFDNTITCGSKSSSDSSDDVSSDVATAWLPLGPLPLTIGTTTSSSCSNSSSNSSSSSSSASSSDSSIVLGEGTVHGADVLSTLPIDYYPVPLHCSQHSGGVASTVVHTTAAVTTANATAARVGIRMRMLFPEENLPDMFTDVTAAAADIGEVRSLSNAASKSAALKNSTLDLSQELMLTLSGHGVVGSNSDYSTVAVTGVTSDHDRSLDISEQARRHKAEVGNLLHIHVLSAAVYVHVFIVARCCCPLLNR